MSPRDEAISIVNIIGKEIFRGQKIESGVSIKLFTEIRDLLSSGFGKEELLSKIDIYKQNNPSSNSITTIQTILKESSVVKKKVSEDNLIESGIFYFHPRLQITPSMPVINVDHVHGTFASHYCKFYLEIVEKFTVNDLFDYVVRKIPMAHIDMAKDIGSLNYLLKKYDAKKPYNRLDLLLYSIDAGASLMQDLDMAPLTNLLKLDDFIQEGWDYYKRAYNNKVVARLDRVIPREDI